MYIMQTTFDVTLLYRWYIGRIRYIQYFDITSGVYYSIDGIIEEVLYPSYF